MATDNIYQRIYDADIALSSGIRAILPSDPKPPPSVGHILVTESFDTSDVGEVLSNPRIPPSKLRSYNLAQRLFDNYNLLSSIRDDITPEELEEVDCLLAFVVDKPPMRIAREFIERATARSFTDQAWYTRVYQTWFTPFTIGSSPTRSGFEHVFLGEAKAGSNEIGGLHWWYFYLTMMSDIRYGGAVYRNADPATGLFVPEIVTMTFSWSVEGRVLEKEIGGFLVGVSVEGLMAMGMVRASDEASAPNIAVVEGAEIDFKLFKSPDGRSINTFFPVFKRLVASSWIDSPVTTPRSPKTSTAVSLPTIRLMAAVANPLGPTDAGREKITIMNVSSTDVINLNGWRIVGPNKSFIAFGDISLGPAEARTITLPARGSLQLSNSGGSVSVLDAGGSLVHNVTYDPAVAKVQGAVLVWNASDALVNANTSA